MSAEVFSCRLKRISAVILISASTGSAVLAQSPRAAEGSLAAALVPGSTVWITDSRGREDKSRIVDVSGDIVTIRTGEETRRLSATDIRRVRVRHTDNVINGALIGAGGGVAAGLFLCTLTESWEFCRGNQESMITFGALGTGIGIGIDLLIRRHKTIYDAAPGSTRLQAIPIILRGGGGVHVSVTF